MIEPHSPLVIDRSVPEAGQLASVRRRQWVVTEVQGSHLSDTGTSAQNLVSLTSIDEDALGEGLEVIWEIEPGAHVIEKAGLPTVDGQDDSRHLQAFLDAVRWGAATNADRGFLQAPFRSGVAIEDFQLDPMVRAIDMARVNLLIADDVGLGKTIEAGLVIQELLLRHRARSILIVCPASLQEKWRIEMLEKFGLEFRICNTEYIRTLRRERGIHANPWTSFPRLIASMEWAKRGDALRLMRDVLPHQAAYPRTFDILVVDEAHNVAPAGSARYALESQITRYIRTISPHFQHRLFLTATPHNGYTQSFTSLLELLDDQRFSRNILPTQSQLAQVMIRRLKTDLVDKEGNPAYPTRDLRALVVPYTKDERSIQERLHEYCGSREQTCAESGGIGTQFINGLLKKRLLSSPAAFAATLEIHIASLENQGSVKKAKPMDDGILRKAILKAEEDYSDDEEAEGVQAEAVEEASRRTAPPTKKERKLLDEMRTWAQANRNRTDSKAKTLMEWIDEHLRVDGEWNDERVIIFTEYRATHQWLLEILTAQGYGGDRLDVLHGGMDQTKEREPVKAAFQAHPSDSPVRILLATDAASEGIDLQNHCSRLIHLEIPYNPNVMEQRNGRVDRWGQKQKEVQVWHMAGEGHEEDIIRALKKLETMRKDMGSVNPVIAPQWAELIEGKRREIDTREAEARSAKVRPLMRVERDLKDRIAKLHERLDETKTDFHLEPDRIRSTVETGLALAEKPSLRPVELNGAPSGSVFEMPELAGSWASCREGLAHPYNQTIRPITFDHDVAKGRDDVVLVHLNHRLVQMCLRLLRAEVWQPDNVKRLHRVDVCTLPDDEIEDLAVVVISRLVITGADHHRLHEELTVSGGNLGDKGFSRETKVTRLNEWLDDANPILAGEERLSKMKSRFERRENNIRRSIETRSTERLRNLRNILDRQRQREVDNITSVLDELAESIRQELEKEEKPEQFELFTPDERTQVARDEEALRARLERIPIEKASELEMIERRYSDFSERTFPVAVVFLAPESWIDKS